MREAKKIAVELICPNPLNARDGNLDESQSLEFGKELKARGQLVPIIVHLLETMAADKGAAKYMLVDGYRRWVAAQLAGIRELDAIILPEAPSAAALHVLQASLDIHRSSLSAMERARLLARIQEENKWSVGELAANLHMKQPLVSKLLAYLRLDFNVQNLLHAGELDMEKAFIISQEPDAAKQRELAKVAGLSREDLRRHVRNGGTGKVEPKASKAFFALTGGAVITLQRRDLTLSAAIEVLVDAVKELRKGLAQGLDISTQQRVMKDRAKRR